MPLPYLFFHVALTDFGLEHSVLPYTVTHTLKALVMHTFIYLHLASFRFYSVFKTNSYSILLLLVSGL
ncbi:hypothetical protein CW304_25435 [Bacillus sp. UFRGS-B20]|nr:hypothetical protein CW304_25435 [Bacillus sp. UFRGS-B20]